MQLPCAILLDSNIGDKAGGDLRCPLDSFQNNGSQHYSISFEILKKFNEIGAIPTKIQVGTGLTE